MPTKPLGSRQQTSGGWETGWFGTVSQVGKGEQDSCRAILPAPPARISDSLPPPHPHIPSFPPPGSSLARTVSSGSMRILKVCCCSVLSVMVTAMAGPERCRGPGIFTQHAIHAAAILAPSRADSRQLPGQVLRAPTIKARDLQASSLRPPPLTFVGMHEHAHTKLGSAGRGRAGRGGSAVSSHSDRPQILWLLASDAMPLAVTS